MDETLNDTTEQSETVTANGHQADNTQVEPQIVEANNVQEEVETTSQAAEYLAGWQRTRAEFANYKKRIEREMGESRQRGALDSLTKLLPIIDDFERAMQNVPAELEGNAWVSGVSMLLPKLEKLLNDFEVQPLDPVGQVFDPSRHEALGMDDSDTVESGHVTVTLQKGYIAGDRVLRPALVRVAS